jgi:hypothetical protein
MYLCAPLAGQGGRVTEWLYCIRIDRADDASSGVDRPAPVPIAPPDVRPLRKRREAGSD